MRRIAILLLLFCLAVPCLAPRTIGADSPPPGTQTADTPAPGADTAGTDDRKTIRYWLNTKSGVRHNQRCRFYRNTKAGRTCTADEGKACGLCGG